MKNKKIPYVLIIPLLIIAIFAFSYYYFIRIPNKKIAERCIQYDREWANLEDCYGLISLRYGWDIDYYYLLDHIHDYEIARIYNLDQYIYENNKIFVINRKTIENSSSNGIKTTYYQELFQNGKLSDNPYSEISDIPTFLVVDTVSGEVQAYKNITDVPSDQQSYFTKINNQ